MSRRGLRRDESGRFFTGLVLIAIGVLFLLEQFHIAGFNHLLHIWWPMFIVMIGVSSIVGRGKPWSGLWMIAIGLWLELIQLHLFGLTFRNSWPLLLIALGAIMTLRALADTMFGRARENGDER